MTHELTYYQTGILEAVRKGAKLLRDVRDSKGGVTRYRYTCAGRTVLRTAVEALEAARLIEGEPTGPFDRVEYRLV